MTKELKRQQAEHERERVSVGDVSVGLYNNHADIERVPYTNVAFAEQAVLVSVSKLQGFIDSSGSSARHSSTEQRLVSHRARVRSWAFNPSALIPFSSLTTSVALVSNSFLVTTSKALVTTSVALVSFETVHIRFGSFEQLTCGKEQLKCTGQPPQ